MIAVGTALPSFKLQENAPDKTEDTGKLFKGKLSVLFAVPGAFTPTCDEKHLPSFIENFDALKKEGADLIACVAVNDAFVMKAWGKSQGCDGKIRMFSDAQGKFTKACGLEWTDAPFNVVEVLGYMRSRRYAMIVGPDGVVKALLDGDEAFALPVLEALKKVKEEIQKAKEAKKAEKGGKKDGAPEGPQDRAKQLKKVIKEGGKRGVEIEGAGDMGGLQFFSTSVDEPQGDMEFTKASMAAMNEKSDPTEEERKGGSGHIGKMIFSAGPDQLAVVAYLPEAKQAEVSCEEWLKKVLSLHGGSVTETSAGLCCGSVKTDSDKNVFPLKIRESMIIESNNFLRKKGLFPEDDDDDDEMIFGDDDFPS